MKLINFISNFFKSNTNAVGKSIIDEGLRKKKWDLDFNDLGIFSYNTLGFYINLKSGLQAIRWQEIIKLEAYKVDLLTYDEICINIILSNKTITISEETQGWQQFIKKFSSELPLKNNNWNDLVLTTPFTTDFTTIYERFDVKLPLAPNFFSIIKGKTKEDVNNLFSKHGWTIRKCSWANFELENNWTALVLESDDEGLLLHGLFAYHPNNVKAITQIFDELNCVYKIEFCNDDSIVELIEKL